MRTTCSTCQTKPRQQQQKTTMKTNITAFLLVVWVSLSLFYLEHEARAASQRHFPTFHITATNNTLVCHEDFMSVYISKSDFSHLPFSIYVLDERGGYHQAVAVARLCHYFLGETNSFVIFTVASIGCFVKRQKSMMSFTVVIMGPADGGTPRIIQSIRLICNKNMKEPSKYHYPDTSRNVFCTKRGFQITIPRNATIPPLNLDAVWISSDRNHKCLPHKRSADSVTFSFPFADCGTQSVIANGNITYTVVIEGKQHFKKGVVFRDAPFQLTVRCSVALTQMTQLDIAVQQSKSYYPSALISTGILRTEMRFAKDSSYSSFYSTSNPPIVTELGQPVYVEVSVVKNDDMDLSLLLEDCWATPTEDPQDPQRWKLLVKGCPFASDSHRTVVLPVFVEETVNPSLHKRFVVKLFSFAKPPTFKNWVYFHCNVEICKGPNCFQHCTGKHKQKRIPPLAGENSFLGIVSGGPLLYLL